jgi:hypothetical protein
MGSVVGSRATGIRWLPAFWTDKEEARVVDVTGGTFPSHHVSHIDARQTSTRYSEWSGSGSSADSPAGNAYLGGVIAGLHASNNDPVEAALYGTVSASFVVEQKGLPRRTHPASLQFRREPAEAEEAEDSEEEWNGDSPLRRLAILRKRCGL